MDNTLTKNFKIVLREGAGCYYNAYFSVVLYLMSKTVVFP